MAPPITTVVIGEYGDIVASKCSTCKRTKGLDEFALDINNKITGRQRRCRSCFKKYYTKTASMRKHERERKKMPVKVVVSPHVRTQAQAVAKARGMREEEYMAYVITMWLEGDWDSDYEREIERDALATMIEEPRDVDADDYITVQDRVAALLKMVKGEE